jgi:hypothetical protein
VAGGARTQRGPQWRSRDAPWLASPGSRQRSVPQPTFPKVRHGIAELAQIVGRILDDVSTFARDGSQKDDVTQVVVGVKAEPGI